MVVFETDDQIYDARLGQVPGQFVSQVQSILNERGRDDIWVMTSHSDFQQPQSSIVLKESLFSFWFDRGIVGHADSDHSTSVDIGELYRYVKRNVEASSSLRSNGLFVQSPQLFCRSDFGSMTSYPQLVSTVGFAATDSAKEISNEVKRRLGTVAVNPSADGNNPPLAGSTIGNSVASQGGMDAAGAVSQDEQQKATVTHASADTEVVAQDAVGKADDSAQKRSPSTAVRIAECWRIIEQLDQVQFPRPMDLAPSLWHSIQDTLFWYEIKVTKAPPASLGEQTESVIQNLHFGLTRLAAGETVPKSIDPRISKLSELGIGRDLNVAGPVVELINKKDLSIRTWILENPCSDQESDSARLLLYRLAEESELDEVLIRDAVSVHLAADDLLKFKDIYHGTLRQRYLAVSRRRLLAERQLIDRTRPDWRSFALTVFEEVRKQYKEILDDLVLIAEARRMQYELLAALQPYQQLSFSLAMDRRMNFLSHAEMTRLVDRLERLGQSIAEQDVQRLRNVVRELAPIRSRVLTDPDNFAATALSSAVVNLAALEVLLKSPALSYKKRAEISNAIQEADRKFWETFDPQSPGPPVKLPDSLPRFQERMRNHAAIDLRLFRLKTRGLDLPSAAKHESFKSVNGSLDYYKATVNGYEATISAINRTIEQRRELRDPARYATVRSSLDWCVQAVGMLDPRDLSQLNVDTIYDYRVLADEYGKLRLMYDELRRAQWDASQSDRIRIKRAMAATRNKLNASKGGPPVELDNQQSISIAGPGNLSLESQSESSLTIDIRSYEETPQPVWVLLEFDDTLLEVQTTSGTQTLSSWSLLQSLESKRTQAELKLRWAQSKGVTEEETSDDRRLLGRLGEATDYPVNPSIVGIDPTMVLDTDSAEPFVLNVRRKNAFGREAKLIVKIITAEAYVRHETKVMLPTAPTIKMAASGPPSLVTVVPDGVLLHPLPNRETPFELSIINEHSAAKTVNLKLLTLNRLFDFDLPVGAVSGERADDVIQRFGQTEVVARRSGVSILPGQSNSLAMLLAPELSVADSPLIDDTAASDDKPKSISFGNEFGSVLVIDDSVTGETTFLRISIAVQRPRRFVQPSIDYDAQTRKLSISFVALMQDIVPATGIQLSAHMRFADSSDPTMLSGVLVGPAYRTTLVSIVPISSPWVDVSIDVDGYPRAFTYRIPCQASVQNHQKQVDLFGVRLTTPLPTRTYRAPIDTIQVLLQVDSPADTFPLYSLGRDYVEIGLDLDRDRVFRNEQTTTLVSDRSVTLQVTLGGPFIVIGTQVSDFLLDIPTYSVTNVRANILARLVSGERQSWSDPVDIVLDGTGPTITRVELLPDRSVEVDGTLNARVTADDFGLSGVAKVEFLIDSAQTGLFAEGSKPIEATQDDLFRWLAEVPFKDLRPGTYDLLTRATDKVGNTGPVLATPVAVINKPDDPSQEQANVVSGTVVYDQLPLAFATVTLTPVPAAGQASGDSVSDGPKAMADSIKTSANANGHFVLPSVPAGSYSIRVAGLARNKTRIVEQQIVVKAKPEKPIRLELVAK